MWKGGCQLELACNWDKSLYHTGFSDTVQHSPSLSPGSENRLTVVCWPCQPTGLPAAHRGELKSQVCARNSFTKDTVFLSWDCRNQAPCTGGWKTFLPSALEAKVHSQGVGRAAFPPKVLGWVCSRPPSQLLELPARLAVPRLVAASIQPPPPVLAWPSFSLSVCVCVFSSSKDPVLVD